MNIKPLKHSEYAQMKQLFLDVFSHEPWNDRWANDELDAYMKELMENSNSLTLGLYDEKEELIGCSLGYVFSWWEGREYYIKEFFIARHKQKQGAGEAFLKLLNDFLKAEGVKHTTLMTEKTVPAYRFYQNNGFRELEDSAFLVKRVSRS
ncbi:aminoglycoside 6'-N-acetyltransferase I [Alkalihalobacillus xiaoxiensis]|uniref:Aminoglycoside 6'-N-acetyltransferase I n=1 Tax=Shouchella xiaoxiensis TaxID=766895 RepID=A0ABS2SX25_9BACI|nr:GNAT family N-acetyltransferase [Shouchella xiaoxiensis]MBM7839780.1 aminoglycoside 6'-N-acetyltransferase I [Shouchella xiaoxiensis]